MHTGSLLQTFYTMSTPQHQALLQSINEALPQTQCQRCGYDDCYDYARAIVQNNAPINRCPPGGHQGIQNLAKLTARPPIALDPAVGQESPRMLALIDEAWCIGCTKCLNICPVDAIFGSRKKMHHVLPQYCTGCELCLQVCPVDCIQLTPYSTENPAPTGWAAWSTKEAHKAQTRYKMHQTRHAAKQKTTTLEKTNPQPSTTNPTSAPAPSQVHAQQKKELILKALKQAREKLKSLD